MPNDALEKRDRQSESPLAPRFDPNTAPVKATLLLCSILVIMAGVPIAPSLPAMRAHFAAVAHAEYWVRLVLAMPALTIVVGSPLAGQLADRLGRKWLLFFAALGFAIAGTSGYYLDSLFAILIGRAILGLAVGAAIVSVTALIADYYQGPARSTLIGLQSTAISLGGFAAIALGGVLADIDWRLPFLIYAFGFLLAPAVATLLSEPAEREPEKNSPENSAAPLPWRLLGAIYSIEFLHMLFFYITPIQLPFYLKEQFDLGATRSGFAIASITLSQAVVASLYSRFEARISFAAIAAVAFLCAGIGYGCVGLAENYPQIVASMAIAGLGFGLLMPNSKFWLAQTTAAATRGRALGGLITAFYLGEFFSPVASQLAVDRLGLRGAYGVFGLGLCGLAAIFLRLGRTTLLRVPAISVERS